MGKIAASVLMRVFINGNKADMSGTPFSNQNNIQSMIAENCNYTMLKCCTHSSTILREALDGGEALDLDILQLVGC